jgi:hypothetical protein
VSIGYRWASRALTRARVWQRACQALDHHVPTRTELGVQANYASCTIDPRRINWLSAQSRLHTQYSHGNKDEKNRTAKDEIFAAVRPAISVRSQPYAAREGARCRCSCRPRARALVTIIRLSSEYTRQALVHACPSQSARDETTSVNWKIVKLAENLSYQILEQ